MCLCCLKVLTVFGPKMEWFKSAAWCTVHIMMLLSEYRDIVPAGYVLDMYNKMDKVVKPFWHPKYLPKTGLCTNKILSMAPVHWAQCQFAKIRNPSSMSCGNGSLAKLFWNTWRSLSKLEWYRNNIYSAWKIAASYQNFYNCIFSVSCDTHCLSLRLCTVILLATN